MRRQLLWATLLVLASFGFAHAQGVQSGTLTGQVKSSDGQPLPGATVTVKSPALLGTRSAVTDANGGYIFKALPPGHYTVTFELTGMTTVEQKKAVALGTTEYVDSTLSVATVQETVTVTAEAPTVLAQTSVGANYKGAEVDTLATGRTLQGIAELAPGLTDNTPNAGQVTISGGFAYDNVFLVNGVDVNDNLFGSANNLFIEDAVEEVQVLTSGISAEYGRFQGGVINAITKRGGNTFSGSFRTDFTNPSWRDETPLEDSQGVKRLERTDKTYQATLGGPLVKDRLWFFAAGRKAKLSTSNTFTRTGFPYDALNDNKRFEGKLTGSLSPNHTVQASYTRNTTEDFGPSLAGFAAEKATFYTPSRTLPNSLFVANYNGVLSSKLFFEAQYSQKKFRFVNSGGSDTNIRTGSPIFTLTAPAAYYNAPYFDNTDPEDRDNRQITGNLSYFLSTSSFGRHDLKLGYENYRSTRTGGNSQSPTDYVFYADYLTNAAGAPVLDSEGRLQPVFSTGDNLVQRWLATRNAKLNTTTQSFFLNDKWQINDHWSANLGVRYERVRAEATGGIVGVDTDTIVPRLAVAYDVKGDGKWKLDATYAHYAGKYNDAQIGNNTSVGNPDYLVFLYTGPSGVGRNFAPGFDPRNYTVVLAGVFPTASVFFDSGLSSPVTKEFTFSAGAALPKGGYLKAVYSQRKVTNFIEDYLNQGTGSTRVVRNGVDFGTFTNTVYRNNSDATREYRAMQLQASYRLTDNWTVTGHYTHQFRNFGDFEGEGTNTPGATSVRGDYDTGSVVFNAERHYPLGNLNDYQKHKLRLWTNYDLSLGRAGRLNLGLLFRYDSGQTNSLQANNQAFTAIQNARIAAYASGPSNLSNDVFFGARGSVLYDGQKDIDLALNYDIPVVRSFRPYIKLDVRNVFNKQSLIGYNVTVRQDPASPVDSLGLRTGFTRPAAFGTARNNADYQIPRELRFSVGFRF